ncbi:MAG: 5-(carboxyamino)imidazole ribonucleotide mutase [Tannerellaceae bacterium]|jgi:5-(carboxyamino)imidazole ribonucleotide mutase|nr:5-(carboxyamino)imidazole ribonucleotide mutase [Tannerellaceae bacterium]
METTDLHPTVAILMGSASDLPVIDRAACFFDRMNVPFEMHILSAHRTPAEVEDFARNAKERGIKVIIAAAGMAAHLGGVIAATTTLPVIGVPINASLDGLDSLLSIVQMPPGVPVASVGINATLNAAILTVQILALSDTELAGKILDYKEELKEKVLADDRKLAETAYRCKTN